MQYPDTHTLQARLKGVSVHVTIQGSGLVEVVFIFEATTVIIHKELHTVLEEKFQ